METDGEFYTLVDDDGTEYCFESIGRCEIDGVAYRAFNPADDEDNDEYTILREIPEGNGEFSFESIDDDDEFDKAADYFDYLFSGEIDCDERLDM